MNRLPRTAAALALGAACAALAAPRPQITFYQDDDFRGPAYSTRRAVADLGRVGFNDRASSVVVDGGRWEVCDDGNFRGQCVLLQHGNYPSLRAMGLNDRLSSTRPVGDQRVSQLQQPAPMDAQPYAWRRRPDEMVFQARVTSVQAVRGPPDQRCWIERQPGAAAERSEPNVGRGLLGAVIGGVLGHQIGGGSGRDLATAGGAVAGAVIGANSGRDHPAPPARDVRRCEDRIPDEPAYWDVGYSFRGIQHHLQMSTPPGPTVDVNSQGEPRQ